MDRIVFLVVAVATAALVVPACGDDDNGRGGGTADGGSGGAPGGSGGGGGTGGGAGGTGGEGGTGGGEGLACETFTACGGEVEGTWAVTEACFVQQGIIDIGSDDPACADIPFEFGGQVTGTLTYTATEEIPDLTWAGTESFTIPPACLAAIDAAEGMGCAEIGDNLVCACSDAAGDCSCLCEFEERVVDPLTYTVVGNTITYADDPGQVEFCVREDTLGEIWGEFRLLLQRQ